MKNISKPIQQVLNRDMSLTIFTSDETGCTILGKCEFMNPFFIILILITTAIGFKKFLADASAIEFILNVEGLKSVFNKVKNDKALNTKINSKYTTDYSHAFIFGIDTDFMFATHPPLEERIKRLNEWI